MMAVSGACAFDDRAPLRRAALGAPRASGSSGASRSSRDSAQFSTMVTELADQTYVGTAVALQLAVGFTLTVATIWLIPYLEDGVGWR